MNKKLARRIRQKRNKTWDQNARRQKRFREFQNERNGFKIEMVGETHFKAFAQSAPEAFCTDCGKKILKKDFRTKNFVALQSNRTGDIYYAHAPHFYADVPNKTPSPAMKAKVASVYEKIFRAEFKDFKEFFVEENPPKRE